MSSNYTVRSLLDDPESLEPAWNRFVEAHPKGSIFHTSEMVRTFHSAKGHRPLPLAAVDLSGEILALLVAVRVQTLPGPMGRLSSRSILYAEPLCCDGDEGAAALTQLIARHDFEMVKQVLFTEVRPCSPPGAERRALEQCGYVQMEYLNHVVDVTKPCNELWLDLDRTVRGAIRQCEQRGIQIGRVDSATAVDQLYPLLKLSFAHAKVPLADRSLFDAAFAELHQNGRILAFAAYLGDTPVAIDLLLTFKDRVLVWYAGVQRIRGVSPCSHLRWFELRWAHDNGFSVYDSGGAGQPDVPYGVRKFKSKFGGRLVQYGRYRRVNSPWRLAIAERAYELNRRFHLIR
jgi:hypothetical protein